MLVYVIVQSTTGNGCVATHSIYLVVACISHNKPEAQSIHWDAFHSGQRAPNMCVQIWRELQNNDANLRFVYVATQRTTHNGCVATNSICFMAAFARSNISLEHNQFTGLMYIKPIVHPRYGT